ncbi:branched-chain amino acid ABC transporter permease [Jiangella anatolica]|uniref:Branched-chain amino acid ABC transporter permease n=1 Tax=Jiangella anatolica TaxID=2670374 RepID=A0A2W2CC55_9ACTN|nr:branched-chain amino acid ABC transporter permease [Jiangella anatolica]PZF83356.1 branched-chain amino acid ABC transporter permease [Jiangella anatolica]
MNVLPQLLLNGVILGALYALISVGFVLVVKGSGVINLAQGELVLLGGYVTAWLLGERGLPAVVAVPAAMLLMAAAGLVVERVVVRPLENQSMLALLMATLALATILQGLVPIIFGSEPRSIPSPFNAAPVSVAGLQVPRVNVWSMGIALAFIALVAVFFATTRYGLAMRAASDHRLAAQSLGIRIRRVNAIAWAIAGAAAAFGGFAWGSVLGVDAGLALVGIFVFPVVILGGIDSLAGVVVGGLVVGIAESLATWYVDPLVGGGFGLVAPLLLLIVVLLVRPYGLFGRHEIGRV